MSNLLTRRVGPVFLVRIHGIGVRVIFELRDGDRAWPLLHEFSRGNLVDGSPRAAITVLVGPVRPRRRDWDLGLDPTVHSKYQRKLSETENYNIGFKFFLHLRDCGTSVHNTPIKLANAQ